MAYSEEADEDFKLPLRPWLEKQIHSGKFKGLEWEASSGDSKHFHLPWVKKNLPNWEDFYKIFRAWAEHRGRGEVEKLDDSKLKSNFRCALNKSVDFEEVVSKSQLHRQTGNYKVYRILSPKEVRERKKNRGKIHAKLEPSFDYNYNSDDFKTVDKKSLEFLDNMDNSSADGQMEISMNGLPSSMQSCSTNEIMIDTSNVTFMVQNEEISQFVVPVHPPETDEFCPTLAFSPADNTNVRQQWTDGVPMEDICTVSQTATENEQHIEILLQQLGLKSEKLGECRLIITYNEKQVYDRVLNNMERGYRIFYGDHEDQIRLLQMRRTTDEKMSDYQLPEIPLPLLKQQSQTMAAILDKTALGITICYDPLTLSFQAKRLCQSQVFRFDPHEHNPNETPIKMEREEIVTLFRHGHYVTEYLERLLHSTTIPAPPEAEILLAVGIKPKSRQTLQTMKGLKIELIPYIVKNFRQSYKEANSSLSLCFSNPTSMENLLRQISKNSIVRHKQMH